MAGTLKLQQRINQYDLMLHFLYILPEFGNILIHGKTKRKAEVFHSFISIYVFLAYFETKQQKAFSEKENRYVFQNTVLDILRMKLLTRL